MNDFVDPIIQELRDLRVRLSEEIQRDPVRACEESHKRVMAIATNLVRLSPHSFKATYILPHFRTHEAMDDSHSASACPVQAD